MSYAGDLAQIIRNLLDYAKDKGQLPRLDILLLVKIQLDHLGRLFDFDPRELVDFEELIKLSVHSPAMVKPLWVVAIEAVTRINSKTELITQLRKGERIEE